MTGLLRRIGSHIGSWGKSDAPWLQATSSTLIPWCAAFLLLLTTPRTYLGVGFQPSSAWKAIALLTVVLPLALRPGMRLVAPRKVWLFALVASFGVPYATPNLQVLLSLFVIAGICSIFPGQLADRIRTAYAGSAVILAAAIGVESTYSFVTARADVAAVMAPLLEAVLAALGVNATAAGPYVHVTHYGVTESVLATGDKAGLHFIVPMVLAFALSARLHGFPCRRILAGVAILAAAAIPASAWHALRNLALERPDWWNEHRVAAIFVPAALLAGIVLGRQSVPAPDQLPPSRWPRLLGAVAGATAMAYFWQMVGMGPVRSGAVVIDESHSDWEWSQSKLDTEWYGIRSVYNYYDLRRALGHYYDVRFNEEEITDRLLEGTSVLVLKTPTRPYSNKTKEAIWRFIERGGGVWAVGDHTDAFGMDTYLNALLGKYGLGVHANAVADPEMTRNLYAPSLLSHPMAGRMPTFLFYTGGSVQSPLYARDVVVQDRLHLDDADYSAGTFFGDVKPDLSERVGAVTESAHLATGPGKIAVWSDSTLFSNFSVFMPGKFEYARDTIDWLRRKDAGESQRLWGVGFGLCLFGLCLWRCRDATLLLAAAVGMAIGTSGSRLQYERAAAALAPKSPLPTVDYLEPSPTLYWPTLITIDRPTENSYVSSFIAAQRVGLIPRITESVESENDSKTIVYVGGAPLEGEQRLALMRKLRAGATVIVLDGGRMGPENLSNLLKGTSLDLRQRKDSLSMELVGQSEKPMGIDRTVLSIAGGGQPLLSAGKDCLGTTATVGKGTLAVFTTEAFFSDTGLGSDEEVPNDVQLRRRAILYELLKRGRPKIESGSTATTEIAKP